MGSVSTLAPAARDVVTELTERARDERDLAVLQCWDEGWSAGEIGVAFDITGAAVIGIVHRISVADPEALGRKPITRFDA